MTNKQIKEKGRIAFKANYWFCVLAAFLLELFTVGTTASGNRAAQNADPSQSVQQIVEQASPEDLMVIGGVVFGTVVVIIVISLLLKIFLFNPLSVGCHRFFRKNIEDTNTKIGVIKEGFENFGHIFVTLFLRDLFIALWSLLFVIPGIVKSYAYWLVPYILKDNPELSATEAITRSKELMMGNKWRAFVLDLSFLGWYLLGALTLGIVNLFWTNPYRESTKAQFYLDLLEN